MKNFILCLSLLFILNLVGCQSPNGTNGGEQESFSSEQKRELVTETINQLNRALINRDSVALQSICSEDLSYGHSSGVVQDKAAFIDDAVNGPFRFLTIENQNQTISFSGDLAIVRDLLTGTGINRGDTVTIRIGNAQLYQLDGEGSFQLLFRQAFRM